MNWNQRLFFKINSLVGKNRWADAFGRAGAEWVLIAMLGWYGSISFILNFGNKKLMWLPIITLSVCVILGWILSNIIGRFVQEVRPRMSFPEIKILFWPLSNWKSFPSDHTMVSLLIFLMALIFNLPTAWGLLPLVLWVAWGRVYSGVHYPADILGGATLAAVVSFFAYLVLHLNNFV